MANEWIRRNKWIFVAGPLAFAALVAIGVEVVMHLWNWLLPALFGWHTITFWQALGLLVLSRILFGNLGGGGGSNHSKSDRCKNARWERMTPEEREKFRQDMRARWCGVGAPIGESKDPA
jgi:hypothetical protein